MRNQNTSRTLKLSVLTGVLTGVLSNPEGALSRLCWSGWQVSGGAAGLVSVTKDTGTTGPQVLTGLISVVITHPDMQFNILACPAPARGLSRVTAEV